MGEFTQKWVELLLPYTANYYRKYTGTELAVMSGVPQQSASRYLINLTDSNVLDFEKQGANKLFYLDKNKSSTKMILEILENSKALDFHQKHTEFSKMINELFSIFQSIILFGNGVNIKSKKKLVLNVIFLNSDKQKLKELKINEKIKELEKKYDLKLQKYNLTEGEFSVFLNEKKDLANEILSEHIIFGNVSNVVKIFSEVSR